MKIIFIDIDGTLINYAGEVPESAKVAIKKARENGHLVFINTGRSRAQVFKYIEDVGFDGYICSEGLYVESNGEILKKESLSKEQVDLINDYIKKEKIGFMGEGHTKFIVNSSFLDKMKELIPNGDLERFNKVFPFGEVLEQIPYEDMGKINFPSATDFSKELQKQFGDKLKAGFFTDEGVSYGMMTLGYPNVDKMNGVTFLLNHLEQNENVNQTDVETYAFGDTGGDIGMVVGCTYGVAMGNGSDSLKEKADYVTETVDGNGIYNAFVKYGLI